jgi:hypothetical protein
MKRLSFPIVFLLISLIWLPRAGAVGLGFYFGGGGGTADWEYEYKSSSGRKYTGSYDTEPRRAGLGMVFDTAVAEDTLINYRLNFGYERWFDEGEEKMHDFEGDSVVLRNALGFGALRNEKLRVWLGPQLSFSYVSGNPEDDEKFDISLYGVGFGPVLGVNLHFGDSLSLAMTFGGRYTRYWGDGEYKNGYSRPDYDFDVDEFVAFFNLSLLFRIKDAF